MSLEHAPQRDRRRPRRGRYDPLLIPILDAFEMIGVGHTKGYQMINAGLIETVMVGARRYATRASLEALARPQEQAAA
jgi:hypothetical protein